MLEMSGFLQKTELWHKNLTLAQQLTFFPRRKIAMIYYWKYFKIASKNCDKL